MKSDLRSLDPEIASCEKGEPIPEWCLWCGEYYAYTDAPHYPYCCAECALQAEMDSEEDC